MRTIFATILACLVAFSFPPSSYASQILKKTLQEMTRQSDIVFIGTVKSTKATASRNNHYKFDEWEAQCSVDEVISGELSTKEATITFFVKPETPQTSLPPGDTIEVTRQYIFFVKRDGKGLSFIAPWDSTLIVSDKYGVWDEDQKKDKETVKNSESVINGVPYVTLSHEDVLKKIKKTWESREIKGGPGIGRSTQKPIDWSKFPKTADQTDVESIIKEVDQDNVASVSMFHGGRVEAYTKNYRYLKASANNNNLLVLLQDKIKAKGKDIGFEQE